jgi:hypothetical protein
MEYQVMKLLMIYCDRFKYNPSVKTIEAAPDDDKEKTIDKALAGFIQLEAEDETDLSYIETKLIKNLKWGARKNDTNRIVLHYFAHLSDSKANPEITRHLFDRCMERLKKADYEVFQTPYGYFMDLDINAPGRSLARLFKDVRPSQ